MTKQKNKLLKAALKYAENGWHIFPCKPMSKIPLIGKSEGGNGCLDATTDAEQIMAWWEMCPTANIGLLCGEKSGVAVVDIDVGELKNGWDTLKRFPDLPETVTQMTPTGGAHKIFSISGNPPKNRNGFPTKKDGIDIRSTNYYIMMTPSIHPDTKTEYVWAEKAAPWDIALADFPDCMRPELHEPEPKHKMPLEALARDAVKVTPVVRPAITPVNGTPVTERARRYLQECEAAVQGNAGHDSLLWAARALVIGFELDDATALSLLWDEFNPRCCPPWDMLNPSDVKDFERKVRQVQDTPGTKPRGWLIEEYGLRSGDEALSALGAKFAEGLLSKAETIINDESANREDSCEEEIEPFPVHCLPQQIRDFTVQVSDAQQVDPAGVGLAVLVAAAAALGNAFRLRLKYSGEFDVPPTLWGVVVAPSGSNKTGTFESVMRPLKAVVPFDKVENPMVNPQGRVVLSDVTTEAVIAKLGQNPRGQLVFRGELAGWIKGFNAYKKGGGGDEEVWLEFYDARSYQLDRKTGGEEVFIPAASVCVLGGIQPKILAECFDPSKFASGLVPRLLVVAPPVNYGFWTESSMDKELYKMWEDVVLFLRTRPFKDLCPQPLTHNPHIIELEPTAKSRYIEFFNELVMMMSEGVECVSLFAAKAKGLTGRIALVLHSLEAALGIVDIHDRVARGTMEKAIELTRYFLGQQLRMYGLASGQYEEQRADGVIAWIRKKGGRTTVRKFHQSHRGSRYPRSGDAKADLDRLVSQGKAVVEGKEYVLV